MVKKKKEKARPDSLFSQQKLPIWQPLINIRGTWLIFIFVGISILAMGTALLIVLMSTSEEIEVHYAKHPNVADCKNSLEKARKNCSECALDAKCTYKIEFQVTEEKRLKLPVFMYYQLTNFFQNHRAYVSSRDDKQLAGKLFEDGGIREMSEDYCKDPFRKDGKKIYYPCGAAANAMFSDKFLSLSHHANYQIKLNSDWKLITWEIEHEYKYANPSGINPKGENHKLFEANFVKPKSWTKKVYDDWKSGGGVKNPHFINWMHQAPMPKFRKLYAVIESLTGCGEDKNHMCAGNYTLEVELNYNPPGWKGERSIIFANTSFFGTRKPFMAWFTVFFGSFCIGVGIVFFMIKTFVKTKVHAIRAVSSHSEEPADIASPENDENAGAGEVPPVKVLRKSDEKSHHSKAKPKKFRQKEHESMIEAGVGSEKPSEEVKDNSANPPVDPTSGEPSTTSTAATDTKSIHSHPSKKLKKRKSNKLHPHHPHHAHSAHHPHAKK